MKPVPLKQTPPPSASDFMPQVINCAICMESVMKYCKAAIAQSYHKVANITSALTPITDLTQKAGVIPPTDNPTAAEKTKTTTTTTERWQGLRSMEEKEESCEG